MTQILSPINSAVNSAISGLSKSSGGSGGVPQATVLLAMNFWQENPVAKITQGSITYVPASSAFALGHRGFYYDLAGQIMPRSGLRKTRNLHGTMSDFTAASWEARSTLTRVGVIVVDGQNAMELSFGSSNGSRLQESSGNSFFLRANYRGTYQVRAVSGTTSVRIHTITTSPDIPITEDWIDITHVASGGNDFRRYGIGNNSAGNSGNIYIRRAILEVVAYLDDPPSDYSLGQDELVENEITYLVENTKTIVNNVVIDNSGGLALHSTVQKEGFPILRLERIRKNSENYSQGDLAHHDRTDGRRALYVATAAGMTAANNDPFPGSSTVTDGAVGWEYVSPYSQPGLSYDPPATNLLLNSRDLTATEWIKSDVVNQNINQDWSLSMDRRESGGSIESIAAMGAVIQQLTLPAATRRCTAYIRRLPSFGIAASIEITTDGLTWIEVSNEILEDVFTKISIVVTHANPAVGVRVGSIFQRIYVDFASITDGEVDTAPIITAGAPVTLTPWSWTAPIAGNVNPDSGSFLLQVTPNHDGTQSFAPNSTGRMVTTGDGPNLLTRLSADNTFNSNSLSAGITSFGFNYIANETLNIAVRWDMDADELQVFINGQSSAVGTFTPGFNTLDDIRLFFGSFYGWTVSHFRVYDKDIGAARCLALSDYDS